MTDLHPLAAEDAPVVAAMRQATAPHKGAPMGPEARPMFDAMMAAVTAAEGARFEPGEVGGVAGWWCRSANADPGRLLLYVHGGGYGLGSAEAFRNLASQIAVRAKADAFLPDYRLAPEHPFPAAIEDVLAVYRGLMAQGGERIVVAGDSAGGGLILALLPILRAEGVLPAGAAVMSPWTDLGLTGASLESRADADPIFTRGVLQALADSYARSRDRTDPRMSPLHAALDGLPPIRIDVGDDEVLLDDSVRFAARAAEAGVDVSLSIWAGMPHVFQSSLGHLRAADRSLDAIGAFLSSRLDVPADDAVPSIPPQRSLIMTCVLFVGQEPETVDFSDPSLPPGFNAEKIQAGIDIAKATMTERGWDGDLCMITPDDSGIAMLAAQLAKVDYDCVVIGGGLRLPPKSLPFFERVVNAIHRGAPKAAIAFNTRPQDTAEAAARWIGAD